MPQNSADVVARRRVNVARLYLQGWTQAAIAVEEGVDQSQISLDLTEIRKDWKASTLFDFNEAKTKELARIDLLESTYWTAWEASKTPLKKKQTKLRGEVLQADMKNPQKQQAKALETTEATEERLGDPRYLDGVLKCIQKRVEILGLDAPFKIAPTDTEGNNIGSRVWTVLDHTGGRNVPAPDEKY